MIEIQELEGRSKSEITDLIKGQESNNYEIYVPKSTQLLFSETLAIAIDYNKLAYSGHLLSAVSDDFKFAEVPPQEHESVLFNIKTDNIGGLTDALFEISFGYVNSEENEVYKDVESDVNTEFLMWADQYLSDVEEGKVKAACPYFCQIARQFFDEAGEKEEDL